MFFFFFLTQLMDQTLLRVFTIHVTLSIMDQDSDLWVCLPPTLTATYVYFILGPTKVCIYSINSYAGSARSLN